MNIASLSIKRPVLATVLSLIIVIFGVVGFSFLGLREYPSVDPPIVNVSTTYVGANADVIEAQITEPLEESINGIAGIRTLTSTSADGRSSISVEFNLGVDMEAAANDVRDRVSRALRNLPLDADPPVVSKADADSDPIIMLSVQSNTRNLLDLSDIARYVIKERLQTIPGVSEIAIYGEKKYAMKINLDPAKLAAYGLSPADLKNALLRENIELPSGRIEGYQTELTIRTLGRLTTEDDFNNLIIKESDNTVVKVKDVGIALLAPENERSLLRGNGGIPQVALAIMPQPGENHVAIADEFYKRLDRLKQEIPKDIRFDISLDTTQNIRKAISEVEETILIAFSLVVLIIFLFLRQWRTTLIPVIAIPISLIGAFFIMYMSGFTINILTLLGIVLATGLVVDDAIVVLENIYKKIEQGMSPLEAGFKGSEEIIFAIISTTITLAIVFLPIIFIQGLTGRLFREFAVVVAGSVLISAFVSLTLTPMMSARLLKHSTKHSAFFNRTEIFFNQLTDRYSKSLRWFIDHRWLVFPIMLFSLLLIIGPGALLKSELAPMEDKGRIRIVATAPEGTAFEAMDQYIAKLVSLVDTIPEKEYLIAVTAPGSSGSVNSGFVRLGFSPADQRERSQQQIADWLNGILMKENFGKAYATQEQTVGGGRRSGLPVQYVIQAPDLESLKKVIPTFLEKASNSKVFQVVDVDLKFNKPEIRLEIDRDRANALGVSVKDIAENLQLFFSGQRYGYFIFNGRQYQVIGQASRINRDDPDDLSAIYIKNSKGELIQLSNLIKMTEFSSPPQLFRFNRYISATISAQPAKNYTIGQGIDEMNSIAKVLLPDNFSTALSGTSREFAESSGSLLYAFLFSLLLIYLVLAAQFESFKDPLIIMLTVWLAMAGAALSLWLFGQTLNIFSQIGAIVLIGIVTKNGILIVEFANQRKQNGLSIREAAIDAATQRLRPILMTNLATILGALPIALALGAASTSRVPMGITIIGGLIFALVLTLYAIPAIYTYISNKESTI
ncbi:MAG: efflux RND transporter permease subunit [Sphingobacteriia bacterium]|nr:efflux RND transporter permease subunit [Sphingobacteriia bacterium]